MIVNVEGLSWESIVLDGSDKLVDDLDQDDCAPAPLVKRWRGQGGIKSAWIAKELCGLGASPGRRTQLATQAMSAHDCDCTDNTIATFEVTAAAGAWCFGVMLAALRGFSILPFDVLLHAPPHLDQTRQT